MVRRFSVGLASSRRRLDKFLAAACGDLSRSRIQKLVDESAVSIDGEVERRSSRMTEEGQTIEVRLPDEPSKTPLLAEQIPLDVLLEDSDLLVLNKPPGLVVHPAPGHASGTLVNAILHHCGSGLSGISGEQRPGIVHRLDRDTSGLMVVARSEEAHRRLQAALSARKIEREYLALVEGRPP
ncbi:MAG: pseudouridine synthase, partial [Thermoanaerobaculia bacterium]